VACKYSDNWELVDEEELEEELDEELDAPVQGVTDT
jgi:hypothetical protein